jgi:glucose-1-phosphate thymidylyltransferase
MKKGIIMAGGKGTRMHPLTKVINKHLLPIYDKPLIFFPLSVLMMLGIKEVLIIHNPKDLENFENLLGNGSHLGIKIYYKQQNVPAGIPEGIKIAEDFLNNESFAFILGDNIFFGQDFTKILKTLQNFKKGCVLFTKTVNDPERFGVLYKKKDKLIEIIEKPKKPKSYLAVTGLYIYDNKAINICKKLKKSKRRETEITELNNFYLKKGFVKEIELGRAFTWIDAGTPDSYLSSSNVVQQHQKKNFFQIACLEEIAYNRGNISKKNFIDLILQEKNPEQKKYLEKLLKK